MISTAELIAVVAEVALHIVVLPWLSPTSRTPMELVMIISSKRHCGWEIILPEMGIAFLVLMERFVNIGLFSSLTTFVFSDSLGLG